MKQVKCALGARSYKIQIGSGAIRSLPRWLRKEKIPRAFILADAKLGKPREELRSVLAGAGWEVQEIPVEAGEGLKEIEAVYPIYSRLLEMKADRQSVLFALGGGTVGDVAGFVAATYLRGISWVGLPTTFLAQVDSAVGGKTGINHPAGKNLIGAFHQPSLVVCDTDFLRTLGTRELISGLGETLKYGLAFDAVFYRSLLKDLDNILSLEPRALERAIQKSLQWKCQAVSRDEHDRKGTREVLNFGHTFGHALETLTAYEVFQHGEAVIWGMRFALALSEVRKKLSAKVRKPLDEMLARLPVPAIPAGLEPEQIFQAMKLDKKMKNGKVRFVLLKRLGQAVSDNGVTEKDLLAAYRLLDSRRR